ncbi:PREDICTED: uncharacterized protein LOC101302436 [Fragaria vesca subsp. vesca]
MSSTQSQGQRHLDFLFSWASQWDPNGGVQLASIKRRRHALIKHAFFKITCPFRRWIDPRSDQMIPIHLMVITQSRTRASIHSPIEIGKLKLYGERRFTVPVSDAIPERRDMYKGIVEGFISTMVIVSKTKQPDIMQPIYKAIEKAEPGWPIDVVIMLVTVDILGKSVVPTTKSVFSHLDNVRLDDLESTVRQKPCSLCGKSLDHFCDAGEGITRLSCSHLFHVGCFVQWLELTKLSPAHACPTCHHPPGIVKCWKKNMTRPTPKTPS